MATLAELKTRIQTEINRDDLADDLATVLQQHIAAACEYFADEKFWFNSIVTTTPASAQSVNIPAAVRRIERLTIPAQYTELREVVLPEFERLDGGQTGLPNAYAYYNDQVRLWPAPDATYTLQFTGLAQVDAPTSDSDSNIWTTQAFDLIVSRVKMTLARDVFRDPDGVQLFAAATAELLRKLKRETARRLETPLRARPDGLVRYNRFDISYD